MQHDVRHAPRRHHEHCVLLLLLHYLQHDAWLGERGKVRKLESYIEQIAVEVQARASALERERQERESLAHTYAGLQVCGGGGRWGGGAWSGGEQEGER